MTGTGPTLLDIQVTMLSLPPLVAGAGVIGPQVCAESVQAGGGLAVVYLTAARAGCTCVARQTITGRL